MSEFPSSTLRPALAELPARPLNQRPKVATTKSALSDVLNASTNQPLTPPQTPPKPRDLRSFVTIDGIEARLLEAFKRAEDQSRAYESTEDPEKRHPAADRETDLKLYNKTYQLHEKLGYGVWSDVFRATEFLPPTASDIFAMSPPNSPTSGMLSSNIRILAVKKPSRRDAQKILEKEAKILTHIHSDHRVSSYLVPFHGFDPEYNSIILDAIPLSLEAHIKSAKKQPLSTRTMFDPILGRDSWTGLAEDLINGLTFLHSRGCVHGDIKPANILLRHDNNGQTVPLYCDFSSSRIITNTPQQDVEEVSAVTADYTSPELLKALSKKTDERAIVTFASDVFALAVTLLFAAIGESPYACARMDIQKLGMAKDGTPLEYARRGDQASRVMKGRAVDRALKGGAAKDPEQRLSVEEWKAQVLEVSTTWRHDVRGG